MLDCGANVNARPRHLLEYAILGKAFLKYVHKKKEVRVGLLNIGEEAVKGNDFVMPQGWQWLLLLGVGLATQVGQIGLTKAMQTETASKATSYSYLQVVFAALLGWWLFAELPNLWTCLGGSFIIAGAAVNLLWKKQ